MILFSLFDQLKEEKRMETDEDDSEMDEEIDEEESEREMSDEEGKHLKTKKEEAILITN